MSLRFLGNLDEAWPLDLLLDPRRRMLGLGKLPELCPLNGKDAPPLLAHKQVPSD